MSVLGQIGRFWPKILISTGVSKSFGTQITEETPRQLVPIVFWSGMRPNGPKIPIFGQKCQFWAKFGRFLAKKTIFWGDGVKLLVPSYNHLCVPNNVQPSLGNIEPVLGVHATKRQKIPYLGTMPFCEFKMAKTAFLSTCLIFATVQAH